MRWRRFSSYVLLALMIVRLLRADQRPIPQNILGYILKHILERISDALVAHMKPRQNTSP